MPAVPDIFPRWEPSQERSSGIASGGRRVYGKFTPGGLQNPFSGMGMSGTDGTADSIWKVDYPQTREAAEIPFVQSWAMYIALTIQPFVTMAKWRRFVEDEDTPEGLGRRLP